MQNIRANSDRFYFLTDNRTHEKQGKGPTAANKESRTAIPSQSRGRRDRHALPENREEDEHQRILKAVLGRTPPRKPTSSDDEDGSGYSDIGSVDSEDLTRYGINQDEVDRVVTELKYERARNPKNRSFGIALQEGLHKIGECMHKTFREFS